MSLNYGGVCEFCECHPATFHRSFNVSCTRCLPPTRELKPCATCKAVFYCSASCRKQHHKAHALVCNVNAKILHFAAVLGYSARVEALKEWLEEKAVYPMSVCGASALQLQRHRRRAGQYVLVVHVACKTTDRPLFEGDEKHHFKYSIKSAQCYEMEKLGVHFFPRFTLSNHPGLATIPKITNYMRIIVVDDELPPPVDMHLIRGAIPDRIHEMPYDSDWFMHLQEMTELESLTNMRQYYETIVAPRAAESTFSIGWVACIIVPAAIICWKWLK